MLRFILAQLLFMLFLANPGGSKFQLTRKSIGPREYISCDPGKGLSLDQLPRIRHPRLVYPDEKSIYPQAVANNNTVPAGKLTNKLLDLQLEVVWSDFYPEGNKRPGLRMVTIREKGKSPSIPAPLIRVETGTRIHAVLHNTLPDSSVTFFGLQKRPSSEYDSIRLKPGETKEINFEAGTPGTYLYGVFIPTERDQEEQQLGGGFIVDPKGGSLPDRVLVINNAGFYIDTALFKNGYMESLTINGGSWPNTELFTPSVGDTVRWRVINSSIRNHPMHLHGFNFTLQSLGSVLSDSVIKAGYQPSIVTQTMVGRSTMMLKWVPTRPGNWLFHCHLSFHVTPDIRLPGAADLDQPDQSPHMAGLVVGIQVKPGTSDLITKGPAKEFNLYVDQYYPGKSPRNGFSLAKDFKPDTNAAFTTGPLLLMKQYQPTYVTVENRMQVPTSIHWHGLDLDSWADGVPDWSASDGKMSPSIQPGEKFTYKLTLMRPGTYIYHSHFNDVRQIASGLYGPLIVMGENQVYDPTTDHFYIVGWKNPEPRSFDDVVLNGTTQQPTQDARVGESHRIRLINIQPAGDIKIRMELDSIPYPMKSIAKDGTDFPLIQQTYLKESAFFGVGETADFVFKPLKAGVYNLKVIIVEGQFFWTQKWVVKD
ncbi:MAG TPA: multicopper oxidase domain-containing protein [Chitinophagaceae bacterium]|nr:multicopper oxidase domain-containing protein [Chitinophagaceae bacterium]